jgi:hypothetical protein
LGLTGGSTQVGRSPGKSVPPTSKVIVSHYDLSVKITIQKFNGIVGMFLIAINRKGFWYDLRKNNTSSQSYYQVIVPVVCEQNRNSLFLNRLRLICAISFILIPDRIRIIAKTI